MFTIFIKCLKFTLRKSFRIWSYSVQHFSRIFPNSDWVRRNTEYLSIFSANAAKCGKNEDQNKSEYGLLHYSEMNWCYLELLYCSDTNFIQETVDLPSDQGIEHHRILQYLMYWCLWLHYSFNDTFIIL